MPDITKDMRFRHSLICYAEEHGVTEAAARYNTNRQYVYRWKNRYDGTMESLRDHSRRPHHNSREHTEEDIRLILEVRNKEPDVGLTTLWEKLTERGYKRSMSSLYRFLKRQKNNYKL